MKQLLIDNLKNLLGWSTKRKLVLISIDDYGNVRLDSKKARTALENNNIKLNNPFDQFDALETVQDLDALFSTLSSFKDNNGQNPIITPFAMPCNLDFEKTVNNPIKEPVIEDLPDTFKKMSAIYPDAYTGAWSLWKEGMNKGLFDPQFHGREHFNYADFKNKFKENDPEITQNLNCRSLCGISSSSIPNVNFYSAFSYNSQEDVENLEAILIDGLKKFETVFGRKPNSFTPPAQQFPVDLENRLCEFGLLNYNKPFYRNRHLFDGQYKKEFNLLKKGGNNSPNIIVRNVVFEPCSGGDYHVSKALNQIKAAFRWGKPANISSHRVNFCGHIDESNRKLGIKKLKELLDTIIKTWPDVEFISVTQLGQLILA